MKRTAPSSKGAKRTPSPAVGAGPPNGRPVEIVQAAYSLIAEKGFEGLRTREVAARVGINSATLHYYFPDKEALIRGVIEHLMKELRRSRAPLGASASALEHLRAEFIDIRARLHESPEQLVVLTELAVRAWRDPVIARILRHLDEGWRGHLVSILERGIAEKTFRPELDVGATAGAMMSQLRGLGLQGQLDPARLDSLVQQIALETEYWVSKAPPAKRQSGGPRNR